MTPAELAAYRRRGPWVGYVLRCGDLTARSGDRVLWFSSVLAACDAAEVWTLAGAHLGADWRPVLVGTEEFDRLNKI